MRSWCFTTYRFLEPSDLEVRGCRFKLTHIKTNHREHVFTRHVEVSARCAPCHEGPGSRIRCAASGPKTRTSVRMGGQGRDVFHDADACQCAWLGPKCLSAQCVREKCDCDVSWQVSTVPRKMFPVVIVMLTAVTSPQCPRPRAPRILCALNFRIGQTLLMMSWHALVGASAWVRAQVAPHGGPGVSWADRLRDVWSLMH